MAGYGFRRDLANSRLKIEVGGTEAMRLTAAGAVTLYGGALTINSGGLTVTGTVTLPAATIASTAIKNINGSHITTTADVNILGGPALLFRITTVGTGAGETINVTMAQKIRVVDVWVKPNATGAGADSITVQSTGNAISNAIALGAANTIVRAANLNDANWDIASAGVLRIVQADGDNNPVTDVYVLGLRVS